MNLVLAPDEIPHEIAPVHPVELIIEEIGHVGAEGGLAVLGTPHTLPLVPGIHAVEVNVARVGRRPHAGEEHLALRKVLGIGGCSGTDIFAVQRRPVLFMFQVVGRIEILSVHQRRGAVLFAVQIANQRVGVVGLIFVGGRLDAGTDNHDGEERKADDHRRQAQERGVPEHLSLPERGKEAPEAQGQQRHHEEERPGIVRQAEAVHEDAVEERGQLGQIRDEDEHHQELNHHANHENPQQLLETEVFTFVLAVIEHEDEGGDGEQVQQVYADAEAHEEGDEHNPAVGMGLVGLFVPLAHGPEDEGGEEGAHGIHFALHGAEPEGVGKAVCQGAHGAGAQDCCRTGNAVFPVGPGHDEPLGEKDDGQVQQEDGEGTQEGIHRIHRHGCVGSVYGQREETRNELEHRVSRRMADFQLIGRGDEFTAVPERGRGFYGAKVSGRCNGQHHPGDKGIPTIELFFIHAKSD